MPDRLRDASILSDELLGFVDTFLPLCQPRLLIVTDGELSFTPGGFGLSRFVAALQQHWAEPSLSLAHRGDHPESVTIGGVQYRVARNFDFADEDSAVTIETYDQIWLFGVKSGRGGANPQPLSDPEIRTIAKFMNDGGGVFATGDHGRLGEGLCGKLPRIRHMRDWASVPMGLERNPTAENRIDTILNTGANDLYEFDDQSDHIPQRIYPNYAVTWTAGSWRASIHPLLRLPWSPRSRTDNRGFRRGDDIEVLPDHAHESVCLEVSATTHPAAINGTYQVLDLAFREYPIKPTGHLGAEIVAFGVAAGRSVTPDNLASEQPRWKPPVKPRMFGVISAYDGHQGTGPFANAPAPGRIVCDSTWHHFINVNIDGGGTGRSGLGTGSGAGWVPSADCNKIFRYYQNIVSWLQPANRVICAAARDIMLIRFHPMLIEELIEVGSATDPRQLEALGCEAVRLIESERGDGAMAEALRSMLRNDAETAALADFGDEDGLWRVGSGPGPLVSYCVGRALARVADILPSSRPEELKKRLGDHDLLEQAVQEAFCGAAREAAEIAVRDAEERLQRLSAYSTCKGEAPTPA